MASEQISRALMSIGGDLQNMATIKAQQERDKIQHMRNESLVRLRGEQNRELADVNATRRSEEAAKQREFLATQGELDREHRTELANRTNEYQDRRLNEQYLKNIDSQGQAQLKAIDQQIAEARGMLDKAELESVAGVNEEAKARIESQIDTLQNQRRLTAFQNIVQLKQLGDPRYKDMDDAGMLKAAGYSAEAIERAIQDAKDAGKPIARKSTEPTNRLMDTSEMMLDDERFATNVSGGNARELMATDPRPVPRGTNLLL